MERQEREKVGGNWSRGVAREKEGLLGIMGDPIGWESISRVGVIPWLIEIHSNPNHNL